MRHLRRSLSGTARLSFPDDTGLSRNHLAIERDGDETWALRDLGSKNGTMLNGVKIAERTVLKSGDRITAGHLILIYDGVKARAPKPVVVFDPQSDTAATPAVGTIVSDLTGVFRFVAGPLQPILSPPNTSPPLSAPATNWPAIARCTSFSLLSSIWLWRP